MENTHKTKTCNRCKKNKELSSFNFQKASADNLAYECRECYSNIKLKYSHTKEGFIKQLYRRLVRSSSHRKHNPPTFTKQELYMWINTNIEFRKLFKAWEESNYNKLLTPSIDRLDDYKGYKFSNMQVITWKENNSKFHQDNMSGKNKKKWKALLQYDLKGNFIQEWESGVKVEKALGISRKHIPSVCKGRRNQTGGFIWRYVDEK